MRRFSSIDLVWRYEDLDGAVRARERWAFVEMASRSLRSRPVLLLDPEQCTRRVPVVEQGSRFLRCERPMAPDPAENNLVIEDAGERRIEDWLDATEEIDESFALPIARTLDDSEHESTGVWIARAPDEVHRRVGPHEPLWALFGGPLFGATLALLLLAQQVAGVRFPRPIANRLSTIASWVGLTAYRVEGGDGPFRTLASQTSEARLSMTTLVKRIARASIMGASRWILVMVLASLLACALSALVD